MYTHIIVGSNDIHASKKFYDAAFGALGHEPGLLMGNDTRIIYQGKDGGMFMVVKPRNGEPACHANGGTIGLIAADKAQIDAFHAAGMANGGIDEGAPGPRDYTPGDYAAYIRDPDGNKLCTYISGGEQS